MRGEEEVKKESQTRRLVNFLMKSHAVWRVLFVYILDKPRAVCTVAMWAKFDCEVGHKCWSWSAKEVRKQIASHFAVSVWVSGGQLYNHPSFFHSDYQTIKVWRLSNFGANFAFKLSEACRAIIFISNNPLQWLQMVLPISSKIIHHLDFPTERHC